MRGRFKKKTMFFMVNRFKFNLINARRGKKEREKNEERKKEGREKGRRKQEERMEVIEKSEKYNYTVQNEEVRAEW